MLPLAIYLRVAMLIGTLSTEPTKLQSNSLNLHRFKKYAAIPAGLDE